MGIEGSRRKPPNNVVAPPPPSGPPRMSREHAVQVFVGELISTFAADSLNYLQIGQPLFAEELVQYSKFVRDRAIELGLLEVAKPKPPDSKSGGERR